MSAIAFKELWCLDEGHNFLSVEVELEPTIWILTRSDTNQPVQSQKQARSLKFRIYEEEGLYYPCSENKGADQLRSCCEADLRLCFRIGKIPAFSRCGLYDLTYPVEM